MKKFLLAALLVCGVSTFSHATMGQLGNPGNPLVTPYQSYTPATLWTTTTTVTTGNYRRVGSNLEAWVTIKQLGTVDVVQSLTLGIPSGLAIDSTTITSSAFPGSVGVIGEGAARVGGTLYQLLAYYNSATTFVGVCLTANAAYAYGTVASNTVPAVWNNGDSVTFHIFTPIVGW